VWGWRLQDGWSRKVGGQRITESVEKERKRMFTMWVSLIEWCCDACTKCFQIGPQLHLTKPSISG